MSTEAYLMGMGPYADAIRECLEYPADYYRGIRSGSIVFTSFFECVAREQAKELIGQLGGTLFDFSTHEISLRQIETFLASWPDSDHGWDTEHDRKKLRSIIDQPGWRFFFRIEC